jgi:hypothetical protein
MNLKLSILATILIFAQPVLAWAQNCPTDLWGFGPKQANGSALVLRDGVMPTAQRWTADEIVLTPDQHLYIRVPIAAGGVQWREWNLTTSSFSPVSPP